MIVCVPCKARMRCDKNGHGVRVGSDLSQVYPGDRYRCPQCGQTVVTTNEAPYYSPVVVGDKSPYTVLLHE